MRRLTKLSGIVALCLLWPSLAWAQTVGVVLMVEDAGRGREELTEPLGLELYGHFLKRAPYDRIMRLHGREDATERLAAGVRRMAELCDVVDVFLSIHTTYRSPDELERLIPEASRKLRLVYSTACEGAHYEREAWTRVGAQTIVTHDGINNPLLALPWFLSRWFAGQPVGRTAEEGYVKTQLLDRFLRSLPNFDVSVLPEAEGNRPVVVGDLDLTIMSGLRGQRLPDLPRHLEYDAERGGPAGLMARALAAESYRLDGEDVRGVASLLVLPQALPADVLDRVQEIRMENAAQGWLRLTLDREVEFEDSGVTITASRTVRVRAGRFDVGSRRLKVHVEGLWASRGLLQARVSNLEVRPDDRGGYTVDIGVGVFGLIPWTHSMYMGGTTPRNAPLDRADLRPTRGMIDTLRGGGSGR